jgi:excisionase family DNA binding protein
MTGRMLRTREVADQLGLAKETVLAWVRKGDLPAFRLPSGELRFRETELEDWLEARATSRRGVSPATPQATRTGMLASLPSPALDDEEP